jgi:hypothetical protein
MLTERQEQVLKAEVFYFGYRRTPSKVVSMVRLESNSQYIGRAELVGPRGGRFIAFIRHDGTARKI